MVNLESGDCLEVIPRLVAEGVVVDAIVTDPPYHLISVARGSTPGSTAASKDVFARVKAGGFMGQSWDGGDIAFRPETWAVVASVLRPGGFLLAFGGLRSALCSDGRQDAGNFWRFVIWNLGRLPRTSHIKRPHEIYAIPPQAIPRWSRQVG